MVNKAYYYLLAFFVPH